MSKTAYNITLKGYVGGADFDRNTVDKELADNDGKQVNVLIATYKMAEKRKDSKTMERAAIDYGKINRVDLEDEQAIPLDKILVQPFTATDDPRVLGIEPIPNITDKISAMIEKYRRETIDIEDVEFEECDLELETLFPSGERSVESGEELNE